MKKNDSIDQGFQQALTSAVHKFLKSKLEEIH